MVTKPDAGTILSAVWDYRCKAPLPLSSHDNSLVLLFESSCTIREVIYSDSLRIIAETWEDEGFDEAVYLLSESTGWICGQK